MIKSLELLFMEQWGIKEESELSRIVVCMKLNFCTYDNELLEYEVHLAACAATGVYSQTCPSASTSFLVFIISYLLMGGFHVHIVKPVKRVKWVKKQDVRRSHYRTVTVTHNSPTRRTSSSGPATYTSPDIQNDIYETIDNNDSMPYFRIGKVSEVISICMCWY